MPGDYRHSTEAEWARQDQAGTGLPQRPSRIARRRPGRAAIFSSTVARPGTSPTLRRISGSCSRMRTSSSSPSPRDCPFYPAVSSSKTTLLYLARRRFGAASSPLHRLGRGTSGAILFTRNFRVRALSGQGDVRAAHPQGLSRPGLGNVDAGRLHGRRAHRARAAPASRDRQRLSSRRPSVDEPRPRPPPIPRQERLARRSDHSDGTSPPDPDPSQLRRIPSRRTIRSIRPAASLAPTASTMNGRRPPARPAIFFTRGRSVSPPGERRGSSRSSARLPPRSTPTSWNKP